LDVEALMVVVVVAVVEEEEEEEEEEATRGTVLQPYVCPVGEVKLTMHPE
jgi:hypothetical protein